MQKITVLTLTFCALFLFLGLLPIHGESDLYDEVLRLHVLADSDDPRDQELKLAVRDRILSETRCILADAADRDQAEQLLRAELPRLTACAEETLRGEGCELPVSMILDNEIYPTRTYGSLSFPSGEYLSLRAVIGSGEGRNWWCVLFPPLCLSAATSAEANKDDCISVGLTGEQYKIITETDSTTYRIRFRFLEVLEEATRG